MGLNTGVQWATHSWNPWQGCHPVSAGCANCYMHREKKRYGQDPGVVVRSKPPTFNMPLKIKKSDVVVERPRVFVCSWSDFWIEEADPWRGEAWDIIADCPHLDFLIPTKRPERMLAACRSIKPLRNVWLGASVEDQATFDERIPLLLQTPAAVRFVSIEPCLSGVDLSCGGTVGMYGKEWPGRSCPDWIIQGGESGPGARPMELEWCRSVRDQCQAAGVPYFLKQAHIDGKLVHMPELDGVVHEALPEVQP